MGPPPSKTFQFPVYQIDFSAVASGKHIAASKRRIRWRFGFPNLAALNDGRTGTDCRGEEHEVVVTWSIASGKRQILMDGKEIQYASSRTSVLDHSWTTRGNHVMKIVCHAAAPMSATPGFRQYDFFIDGQSFFNMPKVYELGIRGVADRGPPRGRGGGGGGGYQLEAGAGRAPYEYDQPAPVVRAPRTPAEEDADLRRAIDESLQESRSHLEQKGGPDSYSAPPDVLTSGAATSDLLDFGGPEPALALPAPPVDNNYAYGAPPPPQQQAYPGAPPPHQQYGDPSYQQQQQQQQQQQSYLALPAPPGQGGPPPYGAPAPPPQQQYAPAPAPYQPDASFVPAYGGAGTGYEDPFAPKPPSHNEIANDIMGAYGGQSSAGLATPAAAGSVAPGGYGTPMYGQNQGGGQALALEQEHEHPVQNGGAHGLTLTMNGLVTTEEEEPKDPVEAAMRKLINIDHIDQPAEAKIKLTMKKQEEKKANKHKNKSVPLPPVVQNQVGTGASLEQIMSVKPEHQPKEDIMKAPPQLFHPNAAAAGALVIHGQAPPLQPQGFGVGYSQQGYYQQPPPQQQYYQQQQPPQQQQYYYR